MDVLIILVFVSLVLFVGGLVFLLKGIKNGDFDQGDRLALLPLEPDDVGNQPGPSDPLPTGRGAGETPTSPGSALDGKESI